jgi:small subunit ribosomal protein S2
MCSTKVDISKESLDSSKLPFNRKTFLAEQFLFYKTLVGNKLRFTNSQSYEYIFGRNFVGNNLFDLNKSLILLKRALKFITQVRENGGTVLFVGTRDDLRNVVQSIGIKTKSPYVNYRWLKGLLTNWENTSNSIKFYDLFLKKLDMRNKQRNKMENTFSGIRTMKELPDAIFIMDLSTDYEVLREARALNIPVVAIVDTNIPTRKVDYPIPANSDSILSIIFFANLIISSFKK